MKRHESAIESARATLKDVSRIAVFSGAGMSAESGVPTFRGEEGLWKDFRPEQLATPFAFEADPRLVWEWYGWRRELVYGCQPNGGHLAIAAAQLSPGSEVRVVTQNVDGLHTLALLSVGRGSGGPATVPMPDAAPSHTITELHGSLYRLKCTLCTYSREDRSSIDATSIDTLPRCPECASLLRPGVVWFGEALDTAVLEFAFETATWAEVCIVVGTSAVVEPAASLPRTTSASGGSIIEINVERTPLSHVADVLLQLPAAEALPAIFEE